MQFLFVGLSVLLRMLLIVKFLFRLPTHYSKLSIVISDCKGLSPRHYR